LQPGGQGFKSPWLHPGHRHPRPAAARRPGRPGAPDAGLPARQDATAGLTVTRLADGAGVVSFAGTPYAAGRRWARTPIDVSIVAGSVQLSKHGKLIRLHPIRHDPARELGAFANPQGRPRRKNSANGYVAQVPEPGCRPGTGT
jgi:hypothetical protein